MSEQIVRTFESYFNKEGFEETEDVLSFPSDTVRRDRTLKVSEWW